MRKTLLLFIVVFLCGCRYSKKPKVYTNGKVTIEYPSWLFTTDDIYPEKNTLLQLKNDYRSVYFILIEYGKKPGDQGFDIMCDSVFNQVKHNIKEPNLESNDTSFTTVNGLKVRERQLSGVMSSRQQDHRFLFILDVFETRDGNIYQTAGWMLRHKRALWTKDIQKAAYSLKVKG